ncbi:MAG: alpha/beta hydrolase [Pseudomonadota bacterium]
MPTMQVKGAEIHYRDEGAGEPVVLVHSSACSSSQWDKLIADLGPGYRVLAPDLHGYGQSEFWSGRGPITLADEAAVVERMIALCDQPVHLVGHSYGGAVALKVSRDAAPSIRSLTLVEPVALHLLRGSDSDGAECFSEIRAVADHVAGGVAIGDYQGAMARFVDYWNGPDAWSRLSERKQGALAKAAPKVALDFWAITSEQASLQDYGHVDVPTLLLCGEASPLPTRRITALLGGALPGARVQVVGGAGHMLPLTHPERVNPLITEHLQGVAACARLAA